jgi:RNA recognition motif-containing protein
MNHQTDAVKPRKPSALPNRSKSDHFRLFVGGFDANVTESDLLEHFSQFGTIEKVEINRDRKRGYSKGFGFITCAEICTKKEILSYPHIILGKKVDVNYTIPKNKSFNKKNQLYSKKIYIPKLNSRLSEFDLVNYFSKFGKVMKVYLVKDTLSGKKNSLIGYVEFGNNKAREGVFEEPNEHKIGPFFMECKRYSPHGWNRNFAKNLGFANALVVDREECDLPATFDLDDSESRSDDVVSTEIFEKTKSEILDLLFLKKFQGEIARKWAVFQHFSIGKQLEGDWGRVDKVGVKLEGKANLGKFVSNLWDGRIEIVVEEEGGNLLLRVKFCELGD